jgi:hypothetical protein
MFWTFGGLYLVGLQGLACGTFAWARWRDPGLADGSGFWIAGGLTLLLGLCGIGFETVGLFWDQGSGRRWWTSVLRTLLFIGIGAVAVVGIGPFGQAALMRLTMNGQL